MVVYVRREVLTLLQCPVTTTPQAGLSLTKEGSGNFIISPILGTWCGFLALLYQAREVFSAEVDKWGAGGEMLLWWLALAHEVLSAEAFILHHAVITSLVCKF